MGIFYHKDGYESFNAIVPHRSPRHRVDTMYYVDGSVPSAIQHYISHAYLVSMELKVLIDISINHRRLVNSSNLLSHEQILECVSTITNLKLPSNKFILNRDDIPQVSYEIERLGIELVEVSRAIHNTSILLSSDEYKDTYWNLSHEMYEKFQFYTRNECEEFTESLAQSIRDYIDIHGTVDGVVIEFPDFFQENT